MSQCSGIQINDNNIIYYGSDACGKTQFQNRPCSSTPNFNELTNTACKFYNNPNTGFNAPGLIFLPYQAFETDQRQTMVKTILGLNYVSDGCGIAGPGPVQAGDYQCFCYSVNGNKNVLTFNEPGVGNFCLYVQTKDTQAAGDPNPPALRNQGQGYMQVGGNCTGFVASARVYRDWMYYRWSAQDVPAPIPLLTPKFIQFFPATIGCFPESTQAAITGVQGFFVYSIDDLKTYPDAIPLVIASINSYTNTTTPSYHASQFSKLYDAFIGLSGPTGVCFQPASQGDTCQGNTSTCINYFSNNYSTVCQSDFTDLNLLKNIPLTLTDFDANFAKHCQANPNANECACLNALQNPVIAKLSDNAKINLGCWYTKCSSIDQSTYKPLSKIPSCGAVCINAVELQSVTPEDINKNSVSINQSNTCISKPTPTPSPPGPAPPGPAPAPATKTSTNWIIPVAIGGGVFLFIVVILVVIFARSKK